MNELRIAIIQEWLVTVGGSDKVVKAIKEIFPEADIFTLVANEHTCRELGFEYAKIKTSFIQKLPFAKKGKHRIYLPFFPFAIEKFDLSEYDIIISSSHSVAKGVITNSNQLHICYCHSPVRYAWDLYHSYLKESKLDRGLKGIFAQIVLHRLRTWDIISSFRVDYFISNSNYIAKRINKVYRREAFTIYPNVNVDEFQLNDQKREDFYLACSRLVPYKKINLVVEAFNEMPDRKLIIVGDGPEYKSIAKAKRENTLLLGYLPFEEMKKYMQSAKALIFPPDEDFGMIPVEAQACGTPVIAYGKGGSLETVINDVTGIHFMEQSKKSIIEAVNRFEVKNGLFNPLNIRKHAEKFSEQKFKKKFYEFVINKYSEFKTING